jgi:hypothetical protein
MSYFSQHLYISSPINNYIMIQKNQTNLIKPEFFQKIKNNYPLKHSISIIYNGIRSSIKYNIKKSENGVEKLVLNATQTNKKSESFFLSKNKYMNSNIENKVKSNYKNRIENIIYTNKNPITNCQNLVKVFLDKYCQKTTSFKTDFNPKTYGVNELNQDTLYKPKRNKKEIKFTLDGLNLHTMKFKEETDTNEFYSDLNKILHNYHKSNDNLFNVNNNLMKRYIVKDPNGKTLYVDGYCNVENCTITVKKGEQIAENENIWYKINNKDDFLNTKMLSIVDKLTKTPYSKILEEYKSQKENKIIEQKVA